MNAPFAKDEDARFGLAISRFDEENSRDPHVVFIHGKPRPREVVYAEWLTEWVRKLCPHASEVLLLAARSQHLCRWQIPRSAYPQTRAGYLKWRSELKLFHAGKTAEILHSLGYPPATVEQVRSLNLKLHLATDSECQVLEDALCLVTLQYQFGELLRKTGSEKLIGIVQRTWRKMSPPARAEALRLPFDESEKSVVLQALDALPSETP